MIKRLQRAPLLDSGRRSIRATYEGQLQQRPAILQSISNRTRVFIDKLSVTIFVAPELRAGVQRAFRVQSGLWRDLRRVTNPWSKLLMGYGDAYYLNLACNPMLASEIRDDARPAHICVIQVAPKRGAQQVDRQRFLRLEWNPCKALLANPDYEEKIREMLSRVGAGQYVAQARVTRADFSFDLRNTNIEALLIFTRAGLRKAISFTYFQLKEEFSPLGLKNASQIGARRCPHNLLMYDKAEEQRGRRTRGSSTRRLHRSRLRFEARMKDPCAVITACEVQNPFAFYTVREYRSAQGIRSGHGWIHFLDSCRIRGAQAALSLIANRSERDKYRDSLRVLEPPRWWDVQDLGVESREALVEATRFLREPFSTES